MKSYEFEGDEEPNKKTIIYPKVNCNSGSNNNETDLKPIKRRVIYPKDNSDSDSKELDIRKKKKGWLQDKADSKEIDFKKKER